MQRLEKFTQAYPQIPWRGQTQVLGLILVIIVLVALVAGFYLSVSARAASIGRDIQAMQIQIKEIEQQNETFKAHLASLTSSRVLDARLEKLGFRPINQEDALYVFIPDYPGRRPVSLAPALEEPIVSAPILPEVYTESIFQWLYRQLSPYVLPMFEVK